MVLAERNWSKQPRAYELIFFARALPALSLKVRTALCSNSISFGSKSEEDVSVKAEGRSMFQFAKASFNSWPSRTLPIDAQIEFTERNSMETVSALE